MTFIIAEAGVNHNGDIELAKRLVESAFASGADAVKFQSFIASEEISVYAEKASYQVAQTGADEGQLEMVAKYELSAECQASLKNFANRIGIEFMSSPFDISSIHILTQIGVRRWKIPSGEITNLPYLRHISRLGQPVILSTGMANLGEIEAALAVLEQAGTPRSQITVMHCTTEYPAPLEEVNLRAMQSIAQAFGVPVGYSDHTEGIAVPIAAVAMGARVIEKHLTLDRTMDGPDHRASLEPDQFAAMVQGIRAIERALGDGIKRATASERANLPIVRKSLVASRAIQAGEPFTADNITAKRPGTGISPMQWDALIGRKATRAYAPDELIEW